MPLVLLAAGGTGGHLFPAEALAEALARRSVESALITDARAEGLATTFPPERIFRVPAATPSAKSPIRMARAALTLGVGTLAAAAIINRVRPSVVIGFGGYPTVPPVTAASLMRIPTILHEQNAVMGRANRFLAGRVTAIATGFAQVGGVGTAAVRLVHVGNPVRPAVIEAASRPFQPLPADGPLNLLVFGGSQGARIMADIVPPAVAMLPDAAASRLVVTQQARPEDRDRVAAAYAARGIAATIEPFFKDLPQRIADAHLIIGRSGASTVAELSVIGRPSILVPLPGSLDQDQAANARSLGDIGAARVVAQPDFTPSWLATELAALLGDPPGLTRMAEAAKSAALPDAADRLADLVLSIVATR